MLSETFLDSLADHYLLFKAFHIVSVISWMAGLLYLPRLFMYHCEAEKGSKQSETFKVMEYRLMKIIMMPAMLLSFLFGGILLLVPGVLERPFGWFHGKFLAVLLLAGFHGVMGKWRKDFARDANRKSQSFFRIANEIPTVLMIIIVFLVVLKPF
ncbi:MAG: protoporphyrinogen oxidase HemJ [Alphaproteobacteria bacterium]|nr:protoporphyrinogen oxidase HemJ [Alphaproteobacteria bacterium]